MSPISPQNTVPTPSAAAIKAARAGSGDDFSLDDRLPAADLAVTLARPKAAATGKTLPGGPDAKAKDHEKSDKARQTADPLFGWINAMLPPPLARTSVATAATSAGSGVLPSAPQSNATPSDAAEGKVMVPEDSNISAPLGMRDIAAMPGLAAGDQPKSGIAKPATPATPASSSAPAASSSATATPQAQTANPAPARPAAPAQTAGQVFATAILAAQNRKDNDRDAAKADPQIAISHATSTVPTDGVKAPEANHQSGLDLRQDTGLQTMIDRIETLRDNADATDTRIRLTPAGLGTVDVAVRKDGDALHVHFTAEQPETRTLLAEAQPRLNELAQARGIRLGETSVSGGATDAGRQQPQPSFTPDRAAPARARAIKTETIAGQADARVA